MFAEKYRSIGLNILYYRRLKGLSQEALSIKAGLTRSYISKIERGTARCGLEVFFLIAQALEVDPAELIRSAARNRAGAKINLFCNNRL